MRQYLFTVVASSAALVAACGDQTTQPQSRITARTSAAAADRDPGGGRHVVGGVYVSTNGVSGNAVVAFARFENGTLAKIGEFATGGVGTGGGVDPLQSQGAVIMSNDHTRLYVVNAASSSISTFGVLEGGSLRLLGTVSSVGSGPISLALSGHRLFALNQDNSVTGFFLDADGSPQPIPGSRISLGPASDGPSTINASHTGNFLFVTQRAAGAIDVVSVRENGALVSTSRQPSSGAGPFGFAVTSRDQLVVSEAAAAAVSSYRSIPGGALSLVSGSLSTHQAAPCWLVLTNGGRFAYIANAGSSSISGYAVSPDGSLVELNADGRTGVTNSAGATPLDMDLTRDGKFLYVLETGAGAVGAFRVGAHGDLSALPDTPGLAASAGFQGLAAF